MSTTMQSQAVSRVAITTTTGADVGGRDQTRGEPGGEGLDSGTVAAIVVSVTAVIAAVISAVICIVKKTQGNDL